VRSFDRDRNVLSVAGEITSQRSYNWFGQSLSQVYVASVIQDELRVTDDPRVLVSAAVRLEQVTSEGGPGERVVYRNVNPRLSLVARLSAEHSLRVTAATAYRTPSPFENFLELSTYDYYPGEDVPPVPTLVPNPSLEPERAESIELGYRGRLSEWLRTDTVVYAQRLEGPIALSRPALPFQYQHNPDQDHLGLELGLTATAGTAALGHLSYTLTRAVERESGAKTEQFPTHLLSVGGSVRFPDVQVGADFQYISSTRPTLLLPQQDGLVLRQYTVPGQPVLSLRAFRPILGGSAQLFFYAMNVLAPFRDRADLMQHPNANVDPIGATFLVGVKL
jgi:outer membrane receptor protein involved in Fe transport